MSLYPRKQEDVSVAAGTVAISASTKALDSTSSSQPQQPKSNRRAAVHIIGQIEGCAGFGGSQLFCEWLLATDWRLDSPKGSFQGTTQVSSAADLSISDFCAWSHPIEAVVSTDSRTEHGWPKVVLRVFRQELPWGWPGNAPANLAGYGLATIPCVPGMHRLQVSCFAPCAGSPAFCDLAAWLTHVRPHVATDRYIADAELRSFNMTSVSTVATGKVTLLINVLVADVEQVLDIRQKENPIESHAVRELSMRLQRVASDQPSPGLTFVRSKQTRYIKAAERRVEERLEAKAAASAADAANRERATSARDDPFLSNSTPKRDRRRRALQRTNSGSSSHSHASAGTSGDIPLLRRGNRREASTDSAGYADAGWQTHTPGSPVKHGGGPTAFGLEAELRNASAHAHAGQQPPARGGRRGAGEIQAFGLETELGE